MSNPSIRLAIPTLDPNLNGGVQSKARMIYDIAESTGFNPYFVYSQQNQIGNISGSESVHRVHRIGWDETNGRETAIIPQYFPNLPFSEYLFNKHQWREALDEADIYFGVCGSGMCCYPLVQLNKQFGCYVATLMRDERKAMRNQKSISNSLPKRFAMYLRDSLSLPIINQIEKRVYDRADTIVPVSEYTGKRISNIYGASEAIETIPYPIDTNVFKPEPVKICREPFILFAGNLHVPRKNTQLLLRVVELVRKSIPSIKLKLIGTDKFEKLSLIARQMDIQDSVDFEGHVSFEELLKFYQNSDVFAIPSRQEGLAIVGLEAMACGTPVVSTKCGGPEEYVIDGKTGYLIPQDNIEDFANRLIRIIEDKSLHKTLSSNARQFIEDKHSKSIVEPKYSNLFMRLYN